MSTPEEILAEAQRLAAITLIPGKTYDADVMDKIKLAQLCQWQQARIETLENTQAILVEEINRLAQYAPSDYQLSQHTLTNPPRFPLSE